MKRFVLSLLVLSFVLASVGLSAAVSAADEDWDAVVQAAKKEGLVVVYDTSSRMGEAAEGFTTKYGIEVQWTKMGDSEISDRVVREHEARARGADVMVSESAAILMGQLLPQGYVVNYVPSTHKDIIPVEYQNPLAYRFQPRIIGYNTEAYGESPIRNLWDLTTPEWRGKVAMRDPMFTAMQLAWFAEIVEAADEMASAYEKCFGEPITLTTPNAGWEFIKRLASNKPIIFRSDGDVAEAVGARGQVDAPVGLYVLSKHREIPAKNLALEACYGLEPYMGYLYPAYVAITANAASPNAAKLFISYLLDEGGNAWTKDLGNFSTNPKMPPHPDDPLGGIEAWAKVTMPLNAQTTVKYYAELFDFWMKHAK
ncbi:MAG: ABC transporter substrate-binding protein [Firmicutes bacterium]|nr:ABC transporter substrate-binding protein [Bacillota bacterium]